MTDKPYPNSLLTEICELLLEYEIGVDEVRNLAADLPGEYENHVQDRNERAWERWQESLRENGGPDDSAYRRDMIAAGRGHLLN